MVCLLHRHRSYRPNYPVYFLHLSTLLMWGISCCLLHVWAQKKLLNYSSKILWGAYVKGALENTEWNNRIPPASGPECSHYPPDQSIGVISAVTSAGFPPANTANCVWRDTCCRRLSPQSLRRRASAFFPAEEDFWTHVLKPFHCGVSSYALMIDF